MKNTVITSESLGYSTDLEEILDTIDIQEIVDGYALKTFFWDMFIIDALLGNFDRHNGNWGFLINEKLSKAKISPIYDCASCLYPQIDEELMKKVLKSEEEMKNRVYVYPTSAIKYNNQKINYYEFIKNNKYKECKNSLIKIANKIDMNKINEIIDNTIYISDIQKEFYKKMIMFRKKIILDENLEN